MFVQAWCNLSLTAQARPTARAWPLLQEHILAARRDSCTHHLVHAGSHREQAHVCEHHACQVTVGTASSIATRSTLSGLAGACSMRIEVST